MAQYRTTEPRKPSVSYGSSAAMSGSWQRPITFEGSSRSRSISPAKYSLRHPLCQAGRSAPTKRTAWKVVSHPLGVFTGGAAGPIFAVANGTRSGKTTMFRLSGTESDTTSKRSKSSVVAMPPRSPCFVSDAGIENQLRLVGDVFCGEDGVQRMLFHGSVFSCGCSRTFKTARLRNQNARTCPCGLPPMRMAATVAGSMSAGIRTRRFSHVSVGVT